MRLYNVYFICKSALIELEKFNAERLNDNTYRFLNWRPAIQSIESLMKIDFISGNAKEAYNAVGPVEREETTPHVSNNMYSRFISPYRVIVNKLEAVVDLYESMKNGESKPGIDIKIPNCDNFQEYISLLKEICFVLYQCPYMVCKDEELRFRGTDVGSDWLTFALVISAGAAGAFRILNNLAALINKAIALKSNRDVFLMQEEQLRSMKAKNEVAEETIETFKRMKQFTYQKYIDELKQEIGDVKDGEEEDKVSKTLDKLIDLMDKGIEIYTSIETPKEIKVLFPFSDKQEVLPENFMKYLEDKASEGK